MTLELQDVFAPAIVQEFVADSVEVEVRAVIDEELDRLELRQQATQEDGLLVGVVGGNATHVAQDVCTGVDQIHPLHQCGVGVALGASVEGNLARLLSAGRLGVEVSVELFDAGPRVANPGGGETGMDRVSLTLLEQEHVEVLHVLVGFGVARAVRALPDEGVQLGLRLSMCADVVDILGPIVGVCLDLNAFHEFEEAQLAEGIHGFVQRIQLFLTAYFGSGDFISDVCHGHLSVALWLTRQGSGEYSMRRSIRRVAGEDQRRS